LKVHLDGGRVPAGDYWIIKLGPLIKGYYEWALVSEPEMLFMWVLARNPE
jgi:lipocalin